MEMMRRAAPRVFKRGVQPGENLRCISEIQSSLGQRFRALGGIEGDAHGLNVATKIWGCNSYHRIARRHKPY